MTRSWSRFEAGELDQIDLVYTRFVSLGSQVVTERQLVPLPRPRCSAEAADGDARPADRRRAARRRR